MANPILATKNLLLESGVAVTGSTEAASMPDDNLLSAHPSAPWRITTLSGANVVIDLGAAYGWDVVSLLATSATPTRNMFTRSSDLTHADWTEANLTVAEGNNGVPVVGYPAWDLRETGGVAVHNVSQDVVKPLAKAMRVTLSCYASQESSNRNLMLKVEGATAGDYGRAYFDLANGQVASVGDAGAVDYIADSATITEVGSSGGSTWYRCSITVLTDADANLIGYLSLLSAAYAESFDSGSPTDYVMVGGAQVEYVTGNDDDSPGDFSETEDANASFWQVQGNHVDSWAGPNYNSGLLNLPLESDLVEWAEDVGFIHAVHRPANMKAFRFLRILFYDDNNADGVLDIGACFVGREFQPTYGIAPGSFALDWDEVSRASIAASGQEFREIGTPFRLARFSLQTITRAESKDLSVLRRQAARSGFVFAYIDPADTTTPQDLCVYGYLDDLGGQEHRSSVYYSHDFQIREALP